MDPAPQGLRPEEVALLVAELEPEVQDARVDKIIDRGLHAFEFRFRTRAGRRSLLLSHRPGFTRFHLIDDSPAAPPSPSEAAKRLRDLLQGAKLLGCGQPNGDRLLRLRLVRNEGEQAIQRFVVFELFGAGGRLIVCEGESRIIRFVSGRGGLKMGHPYRFPPAPRNNEAHRSGAGVLEFDPTRYIPDELRGDPLAFHRSLAARMVDAEVLGDRQERRDRLQQKVRDEVRRRGRLQGNLKQDLSRATDWETWQRLAELLKGELHRIERGAVTLSIVDYYSEDMPSIDVTLDPSMSPADNVERFFRRARKGRRSLHQVEARLAACETDLRILEEILALTKNTALEGELAAAESLLGTLSVPLRRSKKKIRDKGRGQRPQGHKRYRSRQGLEILAGRNARDNDRLTLHVARGNDLFFHRAHRPGPHVILRVPAGKQASPESLEDAAFLAGYLGGWRGPAPTVVQWTSVKFVRKPKGLPPGKVLISREREFKVDYRPELLPRLVPENS